MKWENNELNTLMDSAHTDIDNHADTHCFGKNLRIMSSTEQEFSVNEFLNELATANNVSTVIAATSMIDDDGTLILFVFGQGLNFTKKMDKGPVNTNQCILFGVQCVDNPTDPTRNRDFMLIMCSFYFACKELIS